jgi:hypothetical protein
MLRRSEIRKNLKDTVEMLEEMKEGLDEEVNTTSLIPQKLVTTIDNGIDVTWSMAPKMNREEVRRNVGNSNCLIIFDESNVNTFNPMNLFLGKLIFEF